MEFIKLGRIRLLVTVAIALTAAALAHLDLQSSAAQDRARNGAGATPGRTLQAEKVEAQIGDTNLRTRMEMALGGAFAGIWFEPSAAKVHVGVTSATSRQTAEAVAARAGMEEGVVETPVDSTWSQLEAAQTRWNRRLEDLFARGEVSTDLAPDQNSLEVELGSAVPASKQAELRREASAAGVEVSVTTAKSPRLLVPSQAARCKKFEPEKAHCEPPIVGGVRILSNTGTTCTAGPAVILKSPPASTDATDTYLLTAGHCLKDSTGNKWFAFTKGGTETEIGLSTSSLHGELGAENTNKVDAGVIFINNPGKWVREKADIPVPPSIAPWSEEKEVDPFAVTAEGAVPTIGTMSCYSGEGTGTNCGEVVNESKTDTFNPATTTVDKVVEVQLKAATVKGDSGAPWFSKSNPGQVQGIELGGDVNGHEAFEPLKYIFEELTVPRIGGVGREKLKLLTTANQNRHPEKGRFTSQVEKTYLLGSPKETTAFTFNAGKVQCSGAKFEGTEEGLVSLGLGFEAETATVHPTYSSCTAFGFPAEVSTGVCEYRLYPAKTVDIINCETPIKVNVSSLGCNITIGNQTGLSSISYANEGSGSTADITMTPSVTGITYTSSGGFCGSSGTNGTYVGAALEKGYADSGHTTQVGIAWNAS